MFVKKSISGSLKNILCFRNSSFTRKWNLVNATVMVDLKYFDFEQLKLTF